MFLCVSTLGIASPNHLKEQQRGKNKLTFDFLPACDWGHTQSEAASLTQSSFYFHYLLVPSSYRLLSKWLETYLAEPKLLILSLSYLRDTGSNFLGIGMRLQNIRIPWYCLEIEFEFYRFGYWYWDWDWIMSSAVLVLILVSSSDYLNIEIDIEIEIFSTGIFHRYCQLSQTYWTL